MSFEASHYQQILIREFEARCQRNPLYSLRAFARDLSLAPSSLSLILAKKQGLSRKSAEQIATRLQFTAEERRYFCDLVESHDARSKVRRQEATVKLKSDEAQTTELSLDYFRTISDWYHLAILELTALETFVSDIKWIAHRLKITQRECADAIDRLKRLELLEEVDSRLQKTVGFFATTNGIPSRSIRNYHHQVLQKASIALEDQPVDEREFGSSVFAMNESDLNWAREEMLKFRKNLAVRMASAERKTQVYQLSMQLFSLTSVKTQKSAKLPKKRRSV